MPVFIKKPDAFWQLDRRPEGNFWTNPEGTISRPVAEGDYPAGPETYQGNIYRAEGWASGDDGASKSYRLIGDPEPVDYVDARKILGPVPAQVSAPSPMRSDYQIALADRRTEYTASLLEEGPAPVPADDTAFQP